MTLRRLKVAIATAGLALLVVPALALAGQPSEMTVLAGKHGTRPDPNIPPIFR